MKPHYSNTINPIDFPKSKNKMNERIEQCLYQAGLTAQGCWDELDDYAKEGIEKFAQLIVRECASVILEEMKKTPQVHNYWGPFWDGLDSAQKMITKHFGVES